jgi:uncharacterized protein (DUF58 family)
MQTAELLRKVRRLEIRTRHLVENLLAGQSESIFKGRGIEFEEVRPYVPGDEVRDLDWNVTARLGMPYVKRFVEERELTVVLVVDSSRSMRFGTCGSEKRELAAELCGLLAFAALKNQDKVGLLLASDRVEHVVRPARGRRHALRVLRDVIEHRSPVGLTDLGAVARHLLRTLKRRSVLFVLSDFDAPLDPRPWRVLARRHDVTALRLTDPRDEQLPPAGWVEVEDLETGRRRLVRTSSRRFRESYQNECRARRQAATRALRSARCALVDLSTDASVVPVLVRYFAMRRRGRR